MRFLTSKVPWGRGFTLVELMIVVAIIAVLAAIAIPTYSKYIKKSRTSEAISNLGSIAMFEETYYSEADAYIGAVPNPSAVPDSGDIGGRLPFSSSADGWISLGRVMPDGQQVYFQYEIVVGRYDISGNPVTSAGLQEGDQEAATAPGGGDCTNLPKLIAEGTCASDNDRCLAIPPNASSNWFYATAVADQDGDQTCALFVKVIDRPDIAITDDIE